MWTTDTAPPRISVIAGNSSSILLSCIRTSATDSLTSSLPLKLGLPAKKVAVHAYLPLHGSWFWQSVAMKLHL